MHTIIVRLRLLLAALGIIIAAGTGAFMYLEGWSFVDAIYFSVVTVATVGYGDVHPLTPAGKAFTIVLIITGVGTFLGFVASSTEALFAKRQAKIRTQNLNMIAGLFYSEIGNQLLASFAGISRSFGDMKKACAISGDWTDRDFIAAQRTLRKKEFDLTVSRGQFHELRHFLIEKGDLLLRLFENPSLHEKETFTELLRATLHLREELLHREDIYNIPDTDLVHLTGDIQRVYASLFVEWIEYMQHLKLYYPYLFSLAVRICPFNPEPSAIVQ